MDIIGLLISLVVTAISFILISYLPIGVHIANFKIAFISAIVFGLLNAFVKPLLQLFVAIPNLLTLGLFQFVFYLIVNTIIFGLAAALVQGFSLQNKFISALLGAIALAFVNTILNQILANVFGVPVPAR
jgi:putative membrane protein